MLAGIVQCQDALLEPPGCKLEPLHELGHDDLLVWSLLRAI